jgi:hypothetical protein
MASIQSSGAGQSDAVFYSCEHPKCNHQQQDDQYYVMVVVSDNDGVNFTRVQIEYWKLGSLRKKNSGKHQIGVIPKSASNHRSACVGGGEVNAVNQ